MANEKKGGCLQKLGILFVVLIVLGVIAALVGGGSGSKKDYSSTNEGQTSVSTDAGSSSGSTSSATSTQESATKYSITDETATVEDYDVKITGVLTNNTDKDVTYIQISYNLYDADGNQVGSAFDSISNLKAGGTWKFEASYFGSVEGVASYELADVTGF